MKYGIRFSAIAAMAMVGMGFGTTRADDKTLPKCPVMGEPINFAVSVPTDDGPVFMCCKGCIKKFNANPSSFAKEVAAQRAILATRPKVQVTCPVTGEPVNSKITVDHNGKKVALCCKGCVKKFKSNPKKYSAGLANSYTYQTKCPVMDEPIDPKVASVLPGGETVYYCCKGCNKKLMANPAKYAENLEEQGVHINVAKIEAAKDHGHGHGGHGHGGN